MTTQATTPDPLTERVSRLEGAYEHLAAKADLAATEARLIKWTVGAIIGASAVVTVIVRLLG